MARSTRAALSHFAPRPNAPRAIAEKAFELVERAVAEGNPIGVDTFPEVWGPALVIDLFPEWSLEGSPEGLSSSLCEVVGSCGWWDASGVCDGEGVECLLQPWVLVPNCPPLVFPMLRMAR